MKAIWFTGPSKAEVMQVEKPVPGAGEVLVKLVVSTISPGTERAQLVGERYISLNPDKCKEVTWPRTEGYSSAGIVEAVGEGVTKVKPGDRVAMSWSKHQEYVSLAESRVYKIEDDAIPFEEAAMWHIGTFPIAAIRKCRLELGESAIVMGQGVLGQFAVVYLKAAGACPIIAVDPVPEKREMALRIGADYALDPYAPDFAQTVKEITNGGAAVAIEVTGIGKGLDQVLDCMRQFGRVALLGCTRNSDFTINYYNKVHGPGITLIGAHTYARPKVESHGGWWTEVDDVKAQMTMCSHGRVCLSQLVEETFSPNEAPEVYTRLAENKSFPIAQFDWRK